MFHSARRISTISAGSWHWCPWKTARSAELWTKRCSFRSLCTKVGTSTSIAAMKNSTSTNRGVFFLSPQIFSQASHPILQGGGGTEEQTVHMQDWIQQPPTNYVDDSNEDQNVPLRSAPPFHASCLDLARVDRTPRGVSHRWLGVPGGWGAPSWASESLHGLSFWSWRSLNLRIQEILLLQGTPQRFRNLEFFWGKISFGVEIFWNRNCGLVVFFLNSQNTHQKQKQIREKFSIHWCGRFCFKKRKIKCINWSQKNDSLTFTTGLSKKKLSSNFSWVARRSQWKPDSDRKRCSDMNRTDLLVHTLARFVGPIFLGGGAFEQGWNIPSRKLTYPTLAKGKSSTQNWLFSKYISSQDADKICLKTPVATKIQIPSPICVCVFLFLEKKTYIIYPLNNKPPPVFFSGKEAATNRPGSVGTVAAWSSCGRHLGSDPGWVNSTRWIWVFP